MSTKRPSLYSSDLPIQSSAEDKFEFTPFANHIVDEILGNQQPESLVVGLSGTWGSGKTSILNLMDERLNALKSDNRPIISIRFVPWRVRNSEALLTSFLSLLIEKIEAEISKDDTLKSKFSNSLAPIKEYAKALGQIESGIKPIVKALSSFGVPLIDRIFESLAEVRSAFAEETSLDIETLHKNAYEALKELQITVVVMIDDLDRLEPSEIIDILRLVRSTAQLPYVTFFLCYDHNNVREAVEKVLKLDGRKFLSKLIQLPISVPIISYKVLIQITKNNLEYIFSEENSRDVIEESLFTIEILLRRKIIKTSRDISRITNSIKFGKNLTESDNGTVKVCMAVIEAFYPETFEQINESIFREFGNSRNDIASKQNIDSLKEFRQTKNSENETNNAVVQILDILITRLEKEYVS